jgi:hypothetical protein
VIEQQLHEGGRRRAQGPRIGPDEVVWWDEEIDIDRLWNITDY